MENRLACDLIGNAFDLAAACAVAVAQGHCLDDADRRTAFRTMQVAQELNGIRPTFADTEIGPVMIRTARRLPDEGELAGWLRQRA